MRNLLLSAALIAVPVIKLGATALRCLLARLCAATARDNSSHTLLHGLLAIASHARAPHLMLVRVCKATARRMVFASSATVT